MLLCSLSRRRSHLRKIRSFSSTPPSSDLPQPLKILSSLGLPRESFASLLRSSPGAFELGFLRKWQMGLPQLGLGTDPRLVRRVLEHSSRYKIDPDHAKCNLRPLMEIGFSRETLIRILEDVPVILNNAKIIGHKVRILENFGFHSDQINRICGSFPGFLLLDAENRLIPLFMEFRELCFKSEIRRAVVEDPRLLLTLEVGELTRCLELINSLKCRLPIKERILVRGRIDAALAVKKRVDLLCKHGLIRRDALIVIRREPRSILYELDEIEEKIKFLFLEMGFSVDWLIEVPEYLGVNFEKQVVPRHRVIQFLKSTGALDMDVDLRQMVKFTRKRFYNMFVKPYPKCEQIFGGIVRDVVVKPRHLVGLSKLFKPPKHHMSAEDIRNVKSFMEL